MENMRLGPVLTDHESVPEASCSTVSPFLRFVATEPSRMKSVRTEGCHVGLFREFIGTAYCTYGQSTTTSRIRLPVSTASSTNELSEMESVRIFTLDITLAVEVNHFWKMLGSGEDTHTDTHRIHTDACNDNTQRPNMASGKKNNLYGPVSIKHNYSALCSRIIIIFK